MRSPGRGRSPGPRSTPRAFGVWSRRRSPPARNPRVPRMPEAATSLIGRAVPRLEDPRLLAGRAHFVDDVRLPGVVHMAILRSAHAHARIAAVDLTKARAAP